MRDTLALPIRAGLSSASDRGSGLLGPGLTCFLSERVSQSPRAAQ